MQQGVQVIQTREIDVLKEPIIIMFGKIEGGTASNVISDSVTLSGTMRFLFEGGTKKVKGTQSSGRNELFLIFARRIGPSMNSLFYMAIPRW